MFNTSALTTTLKRGVSTEADVAAALGAPTGSGRALMPGDSGPRQVWVYGKTRVDTVGRKSSIKQDSVMVFFKDGRFDGFLWYSDARKDAVWQRLPAK